MNTLFVSTFNYKIWEISASNMIRSYIKNNPIFDILVCYEDSISHYKDNIGSDKIIPISIDNDEFLRNWEDENRDIIPTSMGGLATEKNCPEAFSWQNMRASKWFRKIVSMNIALSKFGDKYDSIIFIDADCVFKKQFTSDLLKNAFGNESVFYHLGEYRKRRGFGVETGVVGFLNNEAGYGILKDWIDMYRDKNFLKYKKWDDGGLFRSLLEERNFSNCIDIVKDFDPIPGKKTHVVEGGIFSEYIMHKKGIHKKSGLLF